MSFSTDDLVLVTGANGHVGSHIVHALLQDPNGPRVQAAVRSQSSAAPLREVFSKHLESGRLTIIYVRDMTAEGAYDDAIQGTTHITHVASPLILDPPNLEKDLLKPAIGGAVGLLKSVSKETSIQAVVMTSSFAAVFDPTRGCSDDYTYTSDDWSPLTYEQGAGREPVNGIDPKYQGFMPYMSSKKLAEEAAWKFYEAEVVGKQEQPGRLLTVLPTYIGGPCILPLKGDDGTDGYSFSQKMIANLAKQKANRGLVDDFPFWIDARDVARAHIQALLRPEAHNKRWILACQKARMWQLAESVKTSFPQRSMEVVKHTDKSFDIACDESLAGLGMESWIPLGEMVKGTIAPVIEKLG